MFVPKVWIKLGDSRWILPAAETVGNATARVWMTNPCDDSKSARAFTRVLFCFNVRFSASTIDNGCVIQPGTFVEIIAGEFEYACAHAGIALTKIIAPKKTITLLKNRATHCVWDFIVYIGIRV